MGQFHEIFKEGKIGFLKTRNRIVMPPMGTNYADEKGFVTERLKDYYEARAMGGAGLCIVEIISIDSPRGNSLVRNLSLHSDDYIPGMAELAGVIKRHGAKAAAQLFHAGVETHRKVTGVQPVGPSVVRTFSGDEPRELEIDEISLLVRRFAEAALRAKKAGFDAVEIHGATYYLIAQFLSRHWNKRHDHYGGSLENRARFLIEVIKGVREAVGQEFTVWCRINGSEFGIEGGITIEDAKQIARLAEGAGADAIHVSSFGGGSEPHMGPTVLDHGILIPIAREIKKGLRIPVIAVGRIDPIQAEEAIARGEVDFISIGRGLIADPELPRKLKDGRKEDIRPCIGCLECINHIIYKMEPLRCSVNPFCGMEGKYRISPSMTRKNVIVVGGGPGGMEAAMVASTRGHKVTLFERESMLGGLLISASIPPKKGDIERLIQYFRAQMEKGEIQIFLNREVRPEDIADLRPDALILACGGSPHVPEIEGLKEAGYVLAEDAIVEKREVGRKVLILGGGMVGLETADYLSEKGKDVTVVEILERLASDMMPITRRLLLDRLRKKGVLLFPAIKEERVEGKRFYFRERDGRQKELEFDTIVLAAGKIPSQAPWEEVRSLVQEIFFVGDITGSHGILEAISAGNEAGMRV